ncbi:hypothetical protein [Thiorhodovibrio winogradskyi]|uniref:hypothetical protein n=1 Tax=Thiorhodovibrio winogradskyi TaxID=77007 RepID=UPI002E28A202|nr:hypothetical protein [Thiorhodovibrio winogradskyi]
MRAVVVLAGVEAAAVTELSLLAAALFAVVFAAVVLLLWSLAELRIGALLLAAVEAFDTLLAVVLASAVFRVAVVPFLGVVFLAGVLVALVVPAAAPAGACAAAVAFMVVAGRFCSAMIAHSL